MDAQIMAYATGEIRPRRTDRWLATHAKTVFDETRLSMYAVDAVSAVGARIMDRAIVLNEKRQAAADGDPILDSLLLEIQVRTVRSALALVEERVSSWVS